MASAANRINRGSRERCGAFLPAPDIAELPYLTALVDSHFLPSTTIKPTPPADLSGLLICAIAPNCAAVNKQIGIAAV
jgi:hypothetical protein